MVVGALAVENKQASGDDIGLADFEDNFAVEAEGVVEAYFQLQKILDTAALEHTVEPEADTGQSWVH